MQKLPTVTVTNKQLHPYSYQEQMTVIVTWQWPNVLLLIIKPGWAAFLPQVACQALLAVVLPLVAGPAAESGMHPAGGASPTTVLVTS